VDSHLATNRYSQLDARFVSRRHPAHWHNDFVGPGTAESTSVAFRFRRECQATTWSRVKSEGSAPRSRVTIGSNIESYG
jgi:hypothetical protein